MSQLIILVRKNVVHLQVDEIMEGGILVITNTRGVKVLEEKMTGTNCKSFFLDQPEGKYRLEINSEKLKLKKTFHIK